MVTHWEKLHAKWKHPLMSAFQDRATEILTSRDEPLTITETTQGDEEGQGDADEAEAAYEGESDEGAVDEEGQQ